MPGPITLAELPADWLTDRRELVARDRVPVRAGAGLTIEVWSEARAAWLRLELPDRAPRFATVADRAAVIAALSQ